MRKSMLAAALGGLLLLLCAAGCRQEETQQQPPATADTAGLVEANPAFLKNFGKPPQGKAGRAYAMVGYLPLRTAPASLRAIPFFLFSTENQLGKILDRLTGGELLLPPDSELYDPFPADLEVSFQPAEQGVLTLELTSRQAWSSTDMAAAGLALAETARQFAEVTRVRILLNGEALPQMPEGGYLHNPQLIVEAGPPQLVMLAGAWQDGSEVPAELLIEFDRPVTVERVKLYDEAGNAVAGEYYTAIFQMAVVVHPEQPERYREGSLLRVEWSVVDNLGRAGSGTATRPLRRLEH